VKVSEVHKTFAICNVYKWSVGGNASEYLYLKDIVLRNPPGLDTLAVGEQLGRLKQFRVMRVGTTNGLEVFDYGLEKTPENRASLTNNVPVPGQ